MKKILIVITVLLLSCDTKQKKQVQQVPVQKTIVSQFKEYPKAKDIELKFLDECVFPEKQFLKGTEIGGLGEIDYDNNKGIYYVLCDNHKSRFYKVKITFKNDKIEDIKFVDVVKLDKKKYPFYTDLDLEALMIQDNKLIISSEGSVDKRKKPHLFEIDTLGKFIEKYPHTNSFVASQETKMGYKGVFEALCKSYDHQGFWVVNEFPFITDGIRPKYAETKSPVRFTYYDKHTKKPTKEFIYELSALPRKKKGNFNTNGLVGILEYKPNHFLVLERSFQNGYIGEEVIPKIYKAVIDDFATNSINLKDLKEPYVPMKKKFVFDFMSVKPQLTEQIVDNLEGLTFGETLSNGHKSIIMISDDNFQLYGKQLNQFILLEFIENEK